MSPYRTRTVILVGVLVVLLIGAFFLPLMYVSTQMRLFSSSGSAQSDARPTHTLSSGNRTIHLAFRDDDVASTTRIATLEAVNNVHAGLGIPVTLGIVPHPLPGSGNELLSTTRSDRYLRSIATNPLFELAQHGYTHQNTLQTGGKSEFGGLPYDKQLAIMHAGQDDMRQAFGVTPKTFIPPFNTGDENTVRAAATLGFTGYSDGMNSSFITRDNVTGLALSGESLVLDGDNVTSMEQATASLIDHAQSGSTIVVLYHIWSFENHDGTVNMHQVQALKTCMEYLKKRGDVDFVRLDHAAESAPLAQPPQMAQVISLPDDYVL